MLTICCCAWDLPLRGIYIPGKAPLEKTHLSFASNCQLDIPSWLGIGTHVHFYSQWRDMAWTCACPVHAATVSVKWYVLDKVTILISFGYCCSLNEWVLHRIMCVNTWSISDDALLRGCGTIRMYILVGRSTTFTVGGLWEFIALSNSSLVSQGWRYEVLVWEVLLSVCCFY